MKTDDLISALSRNLEPAPRARPTMRAGLAAAIGLGLGAALLALTLGLRPDLGVRLEAVLMKAGFSGLLAAATLPLLIASFMPGRPTRGRLLAVLGLAALAFGVAGIALFGAAPERRFLAWTGGGFPWCLVLIPALSTPAAAALAWLARDLAPTRPPLAGAALGGFAGGIGAAVYSMYCPVDSVAFVTTWYTLAIAICAAVGALLATRFLRW